MGYNTERKGDRVLQNQSQYVNLYAILTLDADLDKIFPSRTGGTFVKSRCVAQEIYELPE